MAKPGRPGPTGPHGIPRVVQGTIRQKAWRAMQIKGKFSLADLCRAALTGEEAGREPKSNIAKYVARLAGVGILVEMKRRAAPTCPRSGGEKRWLLVMDLGRAAPVARMNGDVYDPNAARILACRPEAAPAEAVTPEGGDDGQ